MQRDPGAFLQDVVEAADAIGAAIEGLSLEDFCANRMIRSSVEREFILIGEALSSLARLDPRIFAEIEHGPRIIGFRNKLTHEYAKVDQLLVWGVIHAYLQPLRNACLELIVR